MIDRNVLTLGEGVRLPFALITEHFTEYESVRGLMDEVKSAEMAAAAADQLIMDQATGNTIVNRNLKMELSENVLYATATGESTEQIGVERGFSKP